MEGEKDNGYHSNDNELEGDEIGDFENEENNHMLDDLQYDATAEETTLEEPDYAAVRQQRFQRNQDAMKKFNPHIANAMMYSDESEMISVEENAAILIQKYVRGFLAQRKYIEMLMKQFEKEERLRREKTMEQVEEAKLLVENHQLEVQFADYNVIRKNKAQRLTYYVITIQRAWRNYLSAKQTDIENKTDVKMSMQGYDQHNEDLEYEYVAIQMVKDAIRNALINF